MISPPLAYKEASELSRQSLQLPLRGMLKLAPGMALTAEIRQGKRTVTEYLLSPAQRVASEAGRKR